MQNLSGNCGSNCNANNRANSQLTSKYAISDESSDQEELRHNSKRPSHVTTSTETYRSIKDKQPDNEIRYDQRQVKP